VDILLENAAIRCLNMPLIWCRGKMGSAAKIKYNKWKELTRLKKWNMQQVKHYCPDYMYIKSRICTICLLCFGTLDIF